MKRNGPFGRLAATGSVAVAALLIAGAAGAQQTTPPPAAGATPAATTPAATPPPPAPPGPGDIPIAAGAQAESIAATPDGGLIIGTTGGVIYRWMPGDTEATQWVTGLVQTFGVFAHEDTAYMCATNAPASAVVSYRLSSSGPAVATGAWDFPGGGTCNDFAIGDDGTLYVTDTTNGRVLYLAPDRRGNMAFQTLLQSNAIAGADGIAILNGAVYVNDVRSSTLWRIDIDANHRVTDLTQITIDGGTLMAPDGMRTTADGTGLYIAENRGHTIDLVTIDGNTGHLTTVASGFNASTGIAQLGEDGYVVGTVRGGDATAMTYVRKIDLTP